MKWPENIAPGGSMRNTYLTEVDENNIKISLEETEWKVLNWRYIVRKSIRKLLSVIMLLIERHVSAYSEDIVRFNKL
jgi:hypothetical protein